MLIITISGSLALIIFGAVTCAVLLAMPGSHLSALLALIAAAIITVAGAMTLAVKLN